MEAALEGSGLRELGWEWDVPEGGLLFWLKGLEGLDTRIGSRFCDACVEKGVLYVPGELSFTDYEPTHYARLSFGAIPSDRLEEACDRFGKVARDFSV
jgi:DNA-binding transcriptional MocR family regulator